VNATTIQTSDWNRWVNESVGELYGLLCQTYEDYNVSTYTFTLAGGVGGNQLTVGPGTAVPQFSQPRALWMQIQSSVQPYVTIPRLTSLMERNLYTFPNIVPVYGAIPSAWNLVGNTLEVLPPTVAGATYALLYVPVAPTLTQDTDTIDAFWLSINSWHHYVILDVAIKALIKEESLDTAQMLQGRKTAMGQRVLAEAKPRDVSQPQSIVDMSRVRNLWPGGVPGAAPGWGGDWGGGGQW
jgi:hypothetical protein